MSLLNPLQHDNQLIVPINYLIPEYPCQVVHLHQLIISNLVIHRRFLNKLQKQTHVALHQLYIRHYFLL